MLTSDFILSACKLTSVIPEIINTVLILSKQLEGNGNRKRKKNQIKRRQSKKEKIKSNT